MAFDPHDRQLLYHRSANLNKSYFTDRQDRYIQFTASPSLANYCFDFLQTVSQFSYKLLPPAETSSIPAVSEGTKALGVSWSDPDTHPHHIETKASALLSKFQASHLTTTTEPQHSDATAKSTELDDKVYVFPIIQAGQFNIREEERALNLLYNQISHSSTTVTTDASIASKGKDTRPLVNMTSGYFGLYEPYQDLILSSDADTRIVCAAPKVLSILSSYMLILIQVYCFTG